MKLHEIHAETREAQLTAVARAALTVQEIGPWLRTVYGTIAAALTARQAARRDRPSPAATCCRGDRLEVEAGFPVAAPAEAGGGVQPSELPGGQVAVAVHVGPCDQMEPACRALVSWVTEHGGELAGDSWEVYLGDPASEPDPATWRTGIVQPYRAG